MNDDKIIRFGWRGTCRHNKFLVDERANNVECGLCGESLNPFWVIRQFANKESRIREALERTEKLVEKANAKNRCKCEHCEKMTRIHRER